MKLVAQFDSSADTAPSWFKSAVNSVLGLMGSMFSNDITVTLGFGWGEVNGKPLPDGTAASTESTGTLESYAALRQALANSPAKVAQATAAALPSQDPTSGGQFVLTTALKKATGLSDPNSGEVDGYVGVNAGLDWSTDQNAIAPKQFDFVGTIEHEVSEAMGRLGSLSSTYGAGVYAPMDLFRYSDVGERTLSPEAGYFSLLGHRMLQPFNDPTQGGDAADWHPSVAGDSFGDAYQGSASPMTSVDLKVMRALGYRTTSVNAPAPVDLSAGNTVASTVSYQSQGGIGLSGTVSDASSSVELYAGKRDLGAAEVDDHGFWSLDSKLRSRQQRPITAVVTDSSGTTSVVQGAFTIAANVQNQPYAVEQDIYGADGTLTGQVFTNDAGGLYRDASVSTKRNGNLVYAYRGGSYFADKPYTEQVDVLNSAGTVLKQTVSGDAAAGPSVGDPSSHNSYSLLVGEGAKTFVFTDHPGNAVVSSFNVSGTTHDTLSLPSSEFASLAAVLHSTHMAGGDAVIAASPTDTITLQGITKAELRAHPSDFAFHA